MQTERVLKIIDIVILIIVALLCGVFTCLGLFSDLKIDYSLITATLLFAIALHFIFSAFIEMKFLNRENEMAQTIEDSTNKIISSLKGVEIKFFETIEEVDLYIAQRIREAKKNVYDLNWQDYYHSNPHHRNPIDREYSENQIDLAIKNFCENEDNNLYREIFTFSYPNNYGKMKRHTSYGDSYSCSYFDNITNKKFPKIQFVIIDDEEVIFVSSAYRPYLCAIKDKKIVHIFDHYFEQAWNLSEKIKKGSKVNEELIEKIKIDYGIVEE